jgi:hypothetical protein
MITTLLLTLSLFYGSIVHSQNNKELEGLEEFLSSWKNFVSIGDKNPKFLTKITSNCLLSVDIESDNSIKLIFVDKETIKKVYDNRRNIDIENIPKGFLCRDMTSGTKIVSIGEKFLFDSDGHHISVSMKLLEINKDQVVFEYIKSGFFGYMNYSSKETGVFYLELK